MPFFILEKIIQIQPVILSGGSGTRLWPLSRAGYPKQLQVLHGDGTLLQQTATRLAGAPKFAAPMVICNDDQRFLIAEQLREANITPAMIILEPVARSTAPAIAIAALVAAIPAETVLVVMPADHYIEDKVAFQAAINQAATAAMAGHLMTLGIKPTTPHTGYGYIERGTALPQSPDAYHVARFKEKPDAATAEAYCASGKYLWNSGIFVFRADVFLATLERLQPDMVAACRQALAQGKRDLDFLRLDGVAFARAPNLSVDYAVMEHADNAGVLPVAFDWSDVGGWAALWQLGAKDTLGNVTKGDVMLHDVKNSYVRADRRLVTVLGLDNVVVVETADALFVADMKRVDEVKELVARLKLKNRSEAQSHERVWRPWGFYEQLDYGARFQVKQIMVKPGGQLSLQMHHHRAEHWVVVSGTAKVTVGEQVNLLGPNETSYIPIGVKHRLENPGKVPLYLIEVQSGDYLGEDDIVRLEDVYRRG